MRGCSDFDVPAIPSRTGGAASGRRTGANETPFTWPPMRIVPWPTAPEYGAGAGAGAAGAAGPPNDGPPRRRIVP